MRGWGRQRAQLSAGLVQHIVSRYTYNITGMVLHACRLDMKERKTRLATLSESGQPTAYDRHESCSGGCHVCHVMTTASRKIAIELIGTLLVLTQV